MADDVAGSVGSSFRRYLFPSVRPVSFDLSWLAASAGQVFHVHLALTFRVRRIRRRRSR